MRDAQYQKTRLIRLSHRQIKKLLAPDMKSILLVPVVHANMFVEPTGRGVVMINGQAKVARVSFLATLRCCLQKSSAKTCPSEFFTDIEVLYINSGFAKPGRKCKKVKAKSNCLITFLRNQRFEKITFSKTEFQKVRRIADGPRLRIRSSG